jgi:hypothetical protein
VRQAATERGIDYPVAVDNDYAIWHAFTNDAWPVLYFIDTDGRIRDRHFGEGRCGKSERLTQKLLGVDREVVSVEGLGVKAGADWDHLRTSSRGPSGGARQIAGQHRQDHNVPPSKLAMFDPPVTRSTRTCGSTRLGLRRRTCGPLHGPTLTPGTPPRPVTDHALVTEGSLAPDLVGLRPGRRRRGTRG